MKARKSRLRRNHPSSPKSLEHLFGPGAIAIAGVSANPQSLGGQILLNLLDFGYLGRIFPLHPREDTVHGLRCYRSLRDVPEAVDLLALSVPRDAVLPLVDEGVAAGVRSMVVITAGFREVGGEGTPLESALVSKVRSAAIPMLGPNCMGFFNSAARHRVNLTFSPFPVRPGPVAFFSQSGALGVAVQALAARAGLGFSLFASLGNEADVTHRDALAYAASDPNTKVILLYLETFSEAAAFLETARAVTAQKPVVCLKGGRSLAGARAARSHTGALATSDRVFQAAMRQSGIALAGSTTEMIDMALALSKGKAPAGRRVRVITNAGGPGVLAADHLSAHGLPLTPLCESSQTALRTFVPSQASVGNPVDLTAGTPPETYGRAAKLLLEDAGTDTLVSVLVAPPTWDAALFHNELEKAARDSVKPVVAAFPAQPEMIAHARNSSLIATEYPEATGAIVAALSTYAEAAGRAPGRPLRYKIDRDRVKRLLARARGERRALDAEEALLVMRACGIPVAPSVLVKSAAGLDAVARKTGFPLAMKLVAAQVLHKTDAGGVVLGIPNATVLGRAYRAMLERARKAAVTPRGVLLQPMVTGGRELILGFHRGDGDDGGTPMVLAGLGGVFVEALNSVSIRVLPVTAADLREMVEEMPGSRVLGAFRGMPAAALDPLLEALGRLAYLGSAFEEIAEIDINPFVMSADPRRCFALDARVLAR